MKYLILLLLLSFAVPVVPAFGQDFQKVAQVKKKKKKRKKRRRKRRRKRKKKAMGSAKIRAKQSVSAAVTFGAAFEQTPGFGGAAYYHLSDKLSLGLAGHIGTAELAGSLEDVPPITVTQASLGAGLVALNSRYYVLDSLFLTSGLGLRFINTLFSLDVESGPNGTPVFRDVNMAAQSVVAYLAVGNIWSFKSGFFAGAEWAGFTVPLSTTKKFTIDSNLPDDDITFSEAGAKAEAVAGAIAEKAMYMALLIQLGWAF